MSRRPLLVLNAVSGIFNRVLALAKATLDVARAYPFSMPTSRVQSGRREEEVLVNFSDASTPEEDDDEEN